MDNFILMVCGFLGVIGHCLFKANSLQTDAKAANIHFGFKEYLKADWFSISISFLMVFVWFLLREEIGAKYPVINAWQKVSFFATGFMGSYAIQSIRGKAKSYIRTVIDKKTNIADNKNE